MRIGILTSWRVPCGIYQYSARLADALVKIEGVEPVILAGRADEHRSVPEESVHDVHDVARIGLWRDDQQYTLESTRIAHELELDRVHVQYQSMLFRHEDLVRVAACVPTAITYHDNCVPHDFPHQVFDRHFSHRWNIGPPQVEVLPFGIENRPPIVRTFGLGRTQSELIHGICARNGWDFGDASSHEPIHGGGQVWKSHEDLIAWLRGADAIVLWYPDEPMAGSSQAARTAIAARRPVFTNDVKWFEDLPDHMIGGQDYRAGAEYYRKCLGPADLEFQLQTLFPRPYVEDNSWDVVADLLVKRYQGVMARAS